MLTRETGQTGGSTVVVKKSPLEIAKEMARRAASQGAVGNKPVKKKFVNSPYSVFTPIAEQQKETSTVITAEQFQREQAQKRIAALKQWFQQKKELMYAHVQEAKVRNAPSGSTFTTGIVSGDAKSLLPKTKFETLTAISPSKKQVLRSMAYSNMMVHTPNINVPQDTIITKTIRGGNVSYGFRSKTPYEFIAEEYEQTPEWARPIRYGAASIGQLFTTEGLINAAPPVMFYNLVTGKMGGYQERLYNWEYGLSQEKNPLYKWGKFQAPAYENIILPLATGGAIKYISVFGKSLKVGSWASRGFKTWQVGTAGAATTMIGTEIGSTAAQEYHFKTIKSGSTFNLAAGSVIQFGMMGVGAKSKWVSPESSLKWKMSFGKAKNAFFERSPRMDLYRTAIKETYTTGSLRNKVAIERFKYNISKKYVPMSESRIGLRQRFKSNTSIRNIRGKVEGWSARNKAANYRMKYRMGNIKSGFSDFYTGKVSSVKNRLRFNTSKIKYPMNPRSLKAKLSERSIFKESVREPTGKTLQHDFNKLTMDEKGFSLKQKDILRYPAQGKGDVSYDLKNKGFKAPENKPRSLEDIWSKQSRETKAEFLKGNKMKRTITTGKTLYGAKLSSKPAKIFIGEDVQVMPKSKPGLFKKFVAPENKPRSLEDIWSKQSREAKADFLKGGTRNFKQNKLSFDMFKTKKLMIVEGKGIKVLKLESDVSLKNQTPWWAEPKTKNKLSIEPGQSIKRRTVSSSGVVSLDKPIFENYEYIHEKPTINRPLSTEEFNILNISEGWSVNRLGRTTEQRTSRRTGQTLFNTVLSTPRHRQEVNIISIQENEQNRDLFPILLPLTHQGTRQKQEQVSFQEQSQKQEQMTMQVQKTKLKLRLRTPTMPKTKLIIAPVFPKGKQEGWSLSKGKKYTMTLGKRKYRRKRGAMKTLLADPFSVMESQIRFGSATHPRATRSVWEEAESSGWKLGTVELRKGYKKIKRYGLKKNKGNWKI